MKTTLISLSVFGLAIFLLSVIVKEANDHKHSRALKAQQDSTTMFRKAYLKCNTTINGENQFYKNLGK